MPETHPIAFRLAWALASALSGLGLKHVIISPGSRSTPLVLALHEQISIEKHVVIDERSAAFMALGMARELREPVAVVCTSGTAAANYFPAVIEARQSGIPLLVLTADRSALDRSNGAPQSMHQPALFGAYPVFSFDATLPNSEESLHRLEYLAWQAMDAAIQLQGPAHLNLPYDKPFEPLDGVPLPNTASANRWIAPFKMPEIGLNAIPPALRDARRPIVIAGPNNLSGLKGSELIDAVKLAGIPVIAEHSSGLTVDNLGGNRVRGFPWTLRRDELMAELKPDLIIRLGLFPTAGSLERYLERYREVPELYFAAHQDWASPHHPAGMRFHGMPSIELLQKLGENVEKGWNMKWTKSFSYPAFEKSTTLTDGAVWRTLLSQIPADETIWLSNSWAVRDIDLMGQDWDLGSRRIFSARGVSGIDGVSSQALGTALAGRNDVTLVTGDIAFLHDSNALLSSRLIRERRLLIVAVNNQGGQIFRMLPIARHEAVYDAYFGTPQQVSYEKLCAAHGVWYAKANTPSELRSALNGAYSGPGLRVLECNTDPAASMILRKAIWNQD